MFTEPTGAVTSGAEVLEVAGEIDLASAPVLRVRLAHACQTHAGEILVLDFSDLEFIDSTGLGVLVGALRRQRGSGGDLRLACVPPSVERVFMITGLDRVFELYSNLADATTGSGRRKSSTAKSAPD